MNTIAWILFTPRLVMSLLLGMLWLSGWLLGFPMVAIGLLFCGKESIHMPWPFWLWDSYAGINGTLGGANANWEALCGGAPQTRRYSNRWKFLAWRNPCGNLGGKLLAAPMPRKQVRLVKDTFWLRYWDSGFLWELGFMDSHIRLGWKLSDRGQFLFRFKL